MVPTYKYISQVSRGFTISVCAHANVCAYVYMFACVFACVYKAFPVPWGYIREADLTPLLCCGALGGWRDAGVNESDSKQFILLHLNCHLMRLQSGALSKKQLISHSSVQGGGGCGRWNSIVLLGLTIKFNQTNATFHLKHSISLDYCSKWFCREKN